MRAMRVLYQFPMSVFSRRARLALAHKGIEVELRDARANQGWLEEALRLSPMRTMPVLVDEGRVLGDSGAIAQYLDLAYPDRSALWPRGGEAASEALAITTAVDNAMNALADMGTRNWSLRNDPAWPQVSGERLSRAQASIDAVAAKATRPFLVGDAWSVADMWTISAVLWVAGMPARVSTSPQIAQIMTFGFRMPETLVAWAKQHEDRPDVRSVY
jgi:glutathione S-transferase